MSTTTSVTSNGYLLDSLTSSERAYIEKVIKPCGSVQPIVYDDVTEFLGEVQAIAASRPSYLPTYLLIAIAVVGVATAVGSVYGFIPVASVASKILAKHTFTTAAQRGAAIMVAGAIGILYIVVVYSLSSLGLYQRKMINDHRNQMNKVAQQMSIHLDISRRSDVNEAYAGKENLKQVIRASVQLAVPKGKNGGDSDVQKAFRENINALYAEYARGLKKPDDAEVYTQEDVQSSFLGQYLAGDRMVADQALIEFAKLLHKKGIVDCTEFRMAQQPTPKLAESLRKRLGTKSAQQAINTWAEEPTRRIILVHKVTAEILSLLPTVKGIRIKGMGADEEHFLRKMCSRSIDTHPKLQKVEAILPGIPGVEFSSNVVRTYTKVDGKWVANAQ